MTVTERAPTNRYLDRPSPSSLADVIDTILDKGLVIDIYLRVSLVGIELLTIDARIVIASVDTYLRFAEAVHRLDLTNGESAPKGLLDLVEDATHSVAKQKTAGAIDAVVERVEKVFSRDDKDEDEEDYEAEERSSRSHGQRPGAAGRRTSSRRREPQPD
jgi:gas vesicle structural protein